MLKTLLVGNTLSKPSRDTLIAWLVATKTGTDLLRAGFSHDRRVGDKTGSGEHGTTNDIGIAWPPGRAPVLIAAISRKRRHPPQRRTPCWPMSSELSL